AIIRSDAVVFCFAATLFGTILYLPLYLQLGRGVGIGTSGLLLLPITLTMALVSSLVGRVISHTGNTTLFPQAGLALAAVTFLLLAASVARAPTWVVMALTGFVGMGLSMVMPPTQVVVQHAAGREALGAATATISFSRSVGGATGTAVVGTLLVALLGTASGGLPVSLDRAIEAGGGNGEALSRADRESLVSHLDSAYRVIFLVLAGIAATGALVARTVPQPDWDDEDAVSAATPRARRSA
ncbi:MAG TPA: MFS transporter, partial [Casimicrobiaceae bacterium]|nr:MFS transporter [Casimicrobiaceae bacterium]